MSNKLFLVCPFSCLENFLRKKYGNDVFFMTSIGAVFNFKEDRFLSFVKDFIIRENIREIYIVSDTSCRFLNDAINKENKYANYTKGIIKELFREQHDIVNQNDTIEKKQIKLAALIVRHQAEMIQQHSLFYHLIKQNNISVKGLVTTMSANKTCLIDLKKAISDEF